MITYKYKIQWLFNLRDVFVANQIDQLENVIKAIGVRSLDKICIRNKDYKIVDNYNGFISHPSGTAEFVTMEYIKTEFANNKDYTFVEILRK